MDRIAGLFERSLALGFRAVKMEVIFRDLVDDREVLITSANFTGRAQHDNIELGVLIRDAEFAARVSGQWHALVTQGIFRGCGGDTDVFP